MKPLIGITVNFDYHETIGEVTNLGSPLQQWDYISTDYAIAVIAAGGIPVLIPNIPDASKITEVLDHIDGLLISGGADVDPSVYGEYPKSYCGPSVQQRDRIEVKLIKEAYKRKMPIFGVCRGLQIMNATFGGSLFQDIPSDTGFNTHSINIYERNVPVHPVTIDPKSQLAKILGKDKTETNSYHHQSVNRVAKNGTVVATAPDGIVEGMEFQGGHPFTLAVQWHPEMMYDAEDTRKLFTAFVKAAKK